MFCDLCQKDKLSREFPLQSLTEDCDHPPLHCLRCVTKHVETSQKCTQCEQIVTEENLRYKQGKATLKVLFPECIALPPVTVTEVDSSCASTITVMMLGGECAVIPFTPAMSVTQLKSVIEKKLGPVPEKQRLMYKEKELQSWLNDCPATLAKYGVEPNSVLHLIVMLYAIPTGFENIVFDLFWGYPQHGCDYLDASVLLYSGNSFIEVVDWSHTQSQVCNAITHSGDVMDDDMQLGHHTIRVNLKTMAPQVNKLFFTLSAWESPNISKYPNPSLRCFDPKEPNKQLCSDRMDHAAYSQAIIMCAACKMDECWKIFSVRTCSAGNAMNYGPLQNKISDLISEKRV